MKKLLVLPLFLLISCCPAIAMKEQTIENTRIYKIAEMLDDLIYDSKEICKDFFEGMSINFGHRLHDKLTPRQEQICDELYPTISLCKFIKSIGQTANDMAKDCRNEHDDEETSYTAAMLDYQ